MNQRRRDPGDLRSSCFVLGADPAPWRSSVAAAEIRAPAGSGRSPEQILRPGRGSVAVAAVRGRCGDLSAGRVREITGADPSSWVRIRRPGGRPRPWGRSERRRDPGDLRSSCFVLGADPRPWIFGSGFFRLCVRGVWGAGHSGARSRGRRGGGWCPAPAGYPKDYS